MGPFGYHNLEYIYIYIQLESLTIFLFHIYPSHKVLQCYSKSSPIQTVLYIVHLSLFLFLLAFKPWHYFGRFLALPPMAWGKTLQMKSVSLNCALGENDDSGAEKNLSGPTELSGA